MRITKVTVSLSSSFNHPYEAYANFRPAVTLEAEVGENEPTSIAVQALQALAQQLVHEEKQRILAELDAEHGVHGEPEGACACKGPN